MHVPEGTVVGEFDKYTDAVDQVDALIRHDFPAPAIAIVGTDLRSVERVRAKLSYAKVAIRGIVTGSWLGLAYWLFFGGTGSDTVTTATVTSNVQQSLVPAIIIGAGIGMLYQVIRFSVARKSREFLSSSAVVAGRYDVTVPDNLAELAKIKLAEHAEKCADKN